MARLDQSSMASGYSIVKALGFCTKYIQEVNNTKKKVWDDKEKLTMHDKVFKGNEHPCNMNVNFNNQAYTFVIHNAATTKPWCK